MSVRKRLWTTASGEIKEAWITDYLDQNGKRHVEQFTKKKDAVDRQAKARIEVGKGTYIAPNTGITVADAAQNWLNRVNANGRERATVRQYRQHVNLHIVPRLGGIRLAKLTTDIVEKHLVNDLLAKVSRPLARKVLTSFKSMLKVAKYSHIATDVSIESGKRERRLEPGRDIPEAGEIKRLVDAAKTPRQRALLLTAALTGLRASELRGLRWKDVDLNHGVLHVRQRADRFNNIGSPKSEAGTRSVSLAPEVIVALKRWKPACPKGQAKGDDRYVFPNEQGGVWHHKNMLKSLAPVMIAAGVVDADGEPKYALHAFRHFFASWSINPKDRGGRELSAKVVQTLMGHSSIVMTLDTYGHLFPHGDDSKELAAATAALLGGKPTGDNVRKLARARQRTA